MCCSRAVRGRSPHCSPGLTVQSRFYSYRVRTNTLVSTGLRKTSSLWTARHQKWTKDKYTEKSHLIMSKEEFLEFGIFVRAVFSGRKWHKPLPDTQFSCWPAEGHLILFLFGIPGRLQPVPACTGREAEAEAGSVLGACATC